MDEQLLIRFLTRTCTSEELQIIERWITADKANAITVKDYEFICISPDWDKAARKDRNSTKLAQAMEKDIELSKEDSIKMDLNALKTDVSWNKGAIQNYLNQMKIEVSK